MIFIRVDLPAPFSPTRPWISPRRSTKSTSRSATTPPNALEMPCMASGVGPSPDAAASSAVMRSKPVSSDQEVILHPLHAGGVLLGDDRTVGDDALGNVRAGLFSGRDRRHAGDDGAAMDAAGWGAARCE